MNVFTPLTVLPKVHEVSTQNSARESNSLFLLWKFVNQGVDAINKVINNVNVISKDVNQLKNKDNIDNNMYPFKIYSLPDVFYPVGVQTNFNTNWRTVRVRGGLVLTSVVSTGSFVSGCDNYQFQPYQNVLPQYTSSIDIVLPVNVPQYWFWINNNSGSYQLSYGANPIMADSGSSWSTFPSASTTSIPIGYVDTNSSASQNMAFVRQFLNSDVVVQGGGSGPAIEAYDVTGNTSYSAGQRVYVASQFTLNGVTCLPGTFELISGYSTPTSPVNGQIPFIPFISGYSNWWPIAAGLTAVSTCASGVSTTVYLNSTGLT